MVPLPQKENRKYSKPKITGSLYLIFAVLLIGASFLYREYRTRVLSFNFVPQETVEEKNAPAVIIKIDSLNINLPVEEGYIENEIWKISDEFATHLNTSANPKDSGNIVIYGHNKNNILGPIRWIKPGVEIILINSEGEEIKYAVKSTVEVSPKEIEYVLPKEEETLTVYTCTGFADSKRFIVTSTPL